MPSPRVLRRLITPFLLLLVLLVFHRALFFGEAFVPADLLAHLLPWSAGYPTPTTAWNVLRFDGVTQFYPWRWEAARQINAGQIPLWNPYAFAASGGTPLLANSQSAPLYPLNILIFAPLYRAGFFWYAFGLSAALHLFLLAKGMYLLLRAFSCSRSAALLGAATLILSGPVITWLALPTFLCVSAWLPWLLLCIHRAHTKRSFRYVLGAGVVGGMTLLAGHLQIAFYVLLTGFLYVLWRGHFDARGGKIPFLRWTGGSAAALVLTVLLALPQLAPTLELSRLSARAAAGGPTMTGYSAYVANALPIRNLVALLIPDFFGHPNRNNGFYWNANNYAEWSYYVGVLPLLLALFAAFSGFSRRVKQENPMIFFVLLGLLSFLMAFGTPVNLPFFFLIPGYSQTGNPARCLILAAFALAALAAFGLDAVRSGEIEATAKRRAALAAIIVPVILTALGASYATSFARQNLPNAPVAALLQAAAPAVLQSVVLLVLSALALSAVRRTTAAHQPIAVGFALMLSVADLFFWGYGYNPTSPPSAVYPVTPGIAYLQANAKNALIAPLNQRWSNGAQSPPGAILPPNALTVYGLHDVGGYDSLFPAAAKIRAKEANGGEDPSPPENGNIVFTKTADAAITLKARFILVPPAAPDLGSLGLRQVYTGDDMTIYENPAGENYADSFPKTPRYPLSFQMGLIGGLCGLFLLIIGFALRRISADS